MTEKLTPGRRTLLRSISAAVGTAGVAGLGSARGGDNKPTPIGAAGAGNDRGLPVAADGEMVVSYHKVEEDLFAVQPTFHSSSLNDRYGTPTFNYDTQKLPSELVPKSVRDGEQLEYSFRTQRVIGTEREQRTAERTIWKNQIENEEEHPLHVPDLDSHVPLYSYASESDASNKQDRTSPLNVAWENNDSASIKSTMEDGDNGPLWLNSLSYLDFLKIDLHVNLPNGGTKSTTSHVMKVIPSLSCKPQTMQYHIRLYDVPYDEVGAVGQAHRDPCLHGKPEDYISIIPLVDIDANWRLDEAQSAVVNFWDDGHGLHTDEPYVGNTTSDYPSHGGSWAYFDT